MSSRPSADRRAKWESFWSRRQPAAEATHLVSADLVLQLLARQTQLPPQPRVLDLGCGSGRVMELLAAGGCEVVGVDLALAALGEARCRLGSAARLVQADAFQLGLATASFHAVVSLGYASVGSYPGVQTELARIIRPGGLALVDFRHVGLYHLPILPWQGRAFLRGWRRGEVCLPGLGLQLTPSWLAAGFELRAVHLFNTFPPVGSRLSPACCRAFERSFGRRLAPLLARTALGELQRNEP